MKFLNYEIYNIYYLHEKFDQLYFKQDLKFDVNIYVFFALLICLILFMI